MIEFLWSIDQAVTLLSWLHEPYGSVQGERANSAGLVLYSIEAYVSVSIFINIHWNDEASREK